MSVRHTTTVAYREHVLDGKAGTQRQRILNLLESIGPDMSRAEIADYFRQTVAHDTWDGGPVIPLASVCGRVKALIQSGLVRVAREGPDAVTGHTVEYLALVRPAPAQLTFETFLR